MAVGGWPVVAGSAPQPIFAEVMPSVTVHEPRPVHDVTHRVHGACRYHAPFRVTLAGSPKRVVERLEDFTERACLRVRRWPERGHGLEGVVRIELLGGGQVAANQNRQECRAEVAAH